MNATWKNCRRCSSPLHNNRPVHALKWICILLACALVPGCAGGKDPEPVYHASGNPPSLAEWNLFTLSKDKLTLNRNVTPYDLNTPLFSDYAQKLRTVTLPAGMTAKYSERDVFDFPVGTIISKTFYYPRGPGRTVLAHAPPAILPSSLDLRRQQLIETRILVRREDGWAALPYVWNEAQTGASLKRAGDIRSLVLETSDGDKPMPFHYIVPNSNQCAGCHAVNATTKALEPIGPAARHLNRTVNFGGGAQNQIAAWHTAGLVSTLPGSMPKNANWQDETAPLGARARAYLDINCAHCHNANGAADTSGLDLSISAPTGKKFGVCKLPIAAGTGTGDRLYDIVPGDPGASIFTYRMQSTNPAVMMPELGRSLVDTKGIALISNWIASLDGACE